MKKRNNLYLVTSQKDSNGKKTIDVVKEAINGGIDIVQLREKELPLKDKIEIGHAVVRECKINSIPIVINDNPNLCMELNADGVHLGQQDLKKYPVEKTREILGKKIIGVSTHNLVEVELANKLDIDYIAYGPVFQTKTKDYFLGTRDIPQVLEISKHPVVFIGGLNNENIKKLISLNCKNFAGIRFITEAKNIKSSVSNFKKIMEVDKMNIKLNGKNEHITSSMTVMELVKSRDMDPEKVVVEKNLKIVEKDKWNETMISDSDKIEIVCFVGGG